MLLLIECTKRLLDYICRKFFHYVLFEDYLPPIKKELADAIYRGLQRYGYNEGSLEYFKGEDKDDIKIEWLCNGEDYLTVHNPNEGEFLIASHSLGSLFIYTNKEELLTALGKIEYK